MIDAELQARARRLLAGPVRSDDLDQLYLNQRERSHGRDCFREVGDFVAHRGERSKGPVTQQVRDVLTSFRVWSLRLRGRIPTLVDLRAASTANLRLLTDDQLETGIGMRRNAARSKLEKAFRKIGAGRPLSVHDDRLLSLLANHFVWRPAFTDRDLAREFIEVLVLNGILPWQGSDRAMELKDVLAMHAISRMHGAGISLEDGSVAYLHAGFANKERVLEIKVDIGYTDWTKPVQAPVCMFLTSLKAETSCSPALMAGADATAWNALSSPLELGRDGVLVALA